MDNCPSWIAICLPIMSHSSSILVYSIAASLNKFNSPTTEQILLMLEECDVIFFDFRAASISTDSSVMQ